MASSPLRRSTDPRTLSRGRISPGDVLLDTYMRAICRATEERNSPTPSIERRLLLRRPEQIETNSIALSEPLSLYDAKRCNHRKTSFEKCLLARSRHTAVIREEDRALLALHVQEGDDRPHIYRYHEVVVLRRSCLEQSREDDSEEVTTELSVERFHGRVSVSFRKEVISNATASPHREGWNEPNEAEKPRSDHDRHDECRGPFDRLVRAGPADSAHELADD